MIPLGYSRNTIYGTFSGGDVFQISLWASEAPTDQGAAQTQANMLAAAFNTKLTTPPTGSVKPTAILSTTDAYVGVRVYSYVDGSGHARYIGDASISGAGTNGTAGFLPTQTSLVVSLRSAVAGRSATGRIYTPCTRANTSVGGQLSSADVNGLATWWAALIGAWNSAVTPAKIGVLSQLHGTFQPATAVKVDSKLDIQRRRANKIAASNSLIAAIT